ncbi:MAG: hypothetical protein NTY65_13225 [Planctomycetota bacterium]|nr:hypothetical protein [Planctomycetota bacterium]
MQPKWSCLAGALLCLTALVAGGCAPAARQAQRHIGHEVEGALSPAALREAYRTPAFVVRHGGDRFTAVQDTELSADSQVDDTNLLIFAEGSADTIDGFRCTARLLAESPFGFESNPDRLVIIVLKWSKGISAVAEHLNRAAQDEGAAVLADMLEVHRRRHHSDGHVSLVGFSAGTRVIERAFAKAVSERDAGRHEAFEPVDNIVFVGSSVGLMETPQFEGLRGRFINFVNPRDTHFGDRAAYIAPAGEAANPLKLLHQATIERRPRFGASVAGFHTLPVLTAPSQFEAIEALEHSSAPPAARKAFKMVNVPVPPTLVPYNLFGTPLVNDDLDDYVNLAPNHYVMVGRGPGGLTNVPDFKQYRGAAEEFVREFVGDAAFRGRLDRFDLKTVTKGANPIGLPTFVPWAILNPGEKEPAPTNAEPPAKPAS